MKTLDREVPVIEPGGPVEAARRFDRNGGTTRGYSPSEILRSAGHALDMDSYDWSHAGSNLSADEEFFLVFASQVEWSTEGTFASLDISDDPLIGDFLKVWLDQEVVHAQLLARFLDLHGVQVEAIHKAPHHRRGARRGRLVNKGIKRFVGEDFVALHMTWGALNELSTLRYYGLIRAGSNNVLLRHLLRDIIAQESVHYRFYIEMARVRLERSARAQRMTRFALENLWKPVGSGLRSTADIERVMGIFDDHPEVLGRIDDTIASLPGLDGLALLGDLSSRRRVMH